MRAPIVVRFALLALIAGAVQAGEPSPKPAVNATVAPGEYIADGGWGWLTISPAQKQGLPFELESIGGNFHLCSLEGRIVGGKAALEAEGDPQGCVVSFVPTAEGLRVSGPPACREYCGLRAGFEGHYLRPAAGCGQDARRATRAEFKRLYDRKQYTAALAKLSPLPQRCARQINRYERGEVLNDIAIAQYRLGQRAACLKTLAPLQEDAAMSDDEIRDAYPPSDADTWLPIVKAARFNLGLCRKKAR